MTGPENKIENLMKVTLTLQKIAPPGKEGPVVPFEFIYGIGPSGVTPFEKALFGKRAGDRIRLDLPSAEWCQTIGHLELPLREQTGITAPVCLEVTVTAIVRAQDRDVVKAMAAGGGCSDCGCGCGGH